MYSDTNFNVSVNLKKYHIFTLQFSMEAVESILRFFFTASSNMLQMLAQSAILEVFGIKADCHAFVISR